MNKVLSVGIATLDIINVVDHYPDEDEEMRALSQTCRRGGNAGNTAVVLAQLNVESHWLGRLADDNNAQLISNDFQYHDVKFDHAAVQPGSATPTSYITLNENNGSRTIVHYRDLDELAFADTKAIDWHSYDWLHFEARNIEVTRQILSFIKEQTSFAGSISLEVEKVRGNETSLLPFADLVFFSKSYVKMRGFAHCDQFVQAFAEDQKQDWIFPWGEQGSYAFLADASQIHQLAEIVSCIDSVGAGDTFIAATIAARLRKLNWLEALQFANQTAAKKIGRFGFSLADN